MENRVQKVVIVIDNDRANRDRIVDELKHHHYSILEGKVDVDGEKHIKFSTSSKLNTVAIVSDSEELRDLYGRRFPFYYVPTDLLSARELLVRLSLEELAQDLAIEQGKLVGAKGEVQRTKKLSIEGKLKAIENVHKAFETSERLESH